jgi:hypothetical protein
VGGLANFDGSEYLFSIFAGQNYIFAFFRTDYSFPAIIMLNLEVRPDYFFIFLRTQASQIIYFQVFGGQNIYFQKLPVPPSPNQMVVSLVHIALSANITCEATPN